MCVRRSIQAVLAAGFVGVFAGCAQNDVVHLAMLSQKVDQVSAENESLKRDLAKRDATIEGLQTQVSNLLDLGSGRLDHLFVTHKIELVRLTGGADYDGQPGDDGVTVYLRPLDAQGDPIKAAGEIRIQLFDLSREGQPREIGLYVVNDPGQLRASWQSGFLTDHYTIRCGWQPGVGPPESREVTVRAVFRDRLTGREFTAQKRVAVSLVDTPAG